VRETVFSSPSKVYPPLNRVDSDNGEVLIFVVLPDTIPPPLTNMVPPELVISRTKRPSMLPSEGFLQ